MSKTKSALDKLIESTSNHWPTLTPKARAELAQLLADLQAAQERIAEQARQLDEARQLRELAEQLVNSLGYWMNAEEEPQECLKAELALGEWLAANPAPSAVDDMTNRIVDAELKLEPWAESPQEQP